MTKPLRHSASIAAAGALFLGSSIGVAVASTSHHASAKVSDALAGNGIGQARFGDNARAASRHVRVLLGRSPTRSYYRIRACGVDHASAWPGLIVFFRHNRFAGYTYSARTSRVTQRALATSNGFRVGDTIGHGRSLYGHRLRTTLAQGGAWSVTTSSGKLEGFVSHAPPITPRSTVRTIESGDVGCAAVTP